MEKKLSPTQRKIYSDKTGLTSEELQEFVANENNYMDDVVYVAKYILIERGILPPEPETEKKRETEAETVPFEEIINEKPLAEIEYPKHVKEAELSVDGPPFDSAYKSNSLALIVIFIILAIVNQLIPQDNPEMMIATLVIILGVTIWSVYISIKYLKQINREFYLALISVVSPVIGLLVVRYVDYKFKNEETKEIYNKAVEFYKFRVKYGKKERGSDEETQEQLRERISKSMNLKINEYMQWLEKEKNNNALQGEKEAMVKYLIAEFEHESEALPVVDLTFETCIPPSDTESENPAKCPACGYALRPEHKSCPDCGINLG